MIQMNKKKSILSPLRLGVIGTGQIARTILPMLSDQPVTICGVTDVNPSAAQALAKTLGEVPVFDSAAILFGDPTIEAVYLATPPNTHKALVISALNAGKHVICEKPWTLDSSEACNLLAITKAHPELRVSCCSSRFCFSPAAQAAHRAVTEGTLGRLRQVRLTATVNPPTPLDQLPPWKRQTNTSGGGLAVDWGVYELEWLRSTLGTHFVPMEVTAWLSDWRRENTGMDSSYHVVLRCVSGLEIVMSRQSEIGPRNNRIEMRGESGGLDLPFAPDAVDNITRLHQLKPDGKTLETTTVAEPTENWNRILCGPIINLAEAVRNHAEIAASPEGQVLIHTVFDAIYCSGREHRTVTIKL